MQPDEIKMSIKIILIVY